MKTEWKMVRVPADLAVRLASMAAEMEKAHIEGRAMLPGEFAEHCPIHHVIERALTEMEAHKARGKAPKRRLKADRPSLADRS